MPSTRRILQIWLGIAFLLAVIRVPLQARLPLTWNNATEMVEARSFARFGIWQLRAVPLHNNPPIGGDYDAYIHFPPGTPIVLSLLMRWAGDSAFVLNAFMLLVVAAACVALFAIARTWFDSRVALLATLAFLTAPVVIAYGFDMAAPGFILPLMLISLAAFMRGNLAASAIALVAACLCSWEAFVLFPGIALVSAAFKDWRRFRWALALTAVTVALFIGLVMLWHSEVPHLLSDLFHTAAWRAGLVPFRAPMIRLHTIASSTEYTYRFSAIGAEDAIAANIWRMLDPIVLLAGFAVLLVAASQSFAAKQESQLLFGLASPFVLWCLLLSNHAAIMDEQEILLLPSAAICFGVACCKLPQIAATYRRPLSILCFGVIPAMLLLQAAHLTRKSAIPQEEQVTLKRFAEQIKSNTPVGSVVLVPDDDLKVVHYSDRHIVRGIDNEAKLTLAMRLLPRAFPHSRDFLAFRTVDAPRFTNTLLKCRVLAKTADMILLDLN